jgi:cell division protein FtsB
MPLVLCAAALAITYLGFTTLRYVSHNFRVRDEEAQIRRDIAQLDRDHEQLVAVKDYLESDEYVEYVARNTLGLVRPGETLVVVSGTDLPTPTATAEGETPPPDTGAEPWWKELFAGE